MLVAYDSRTGNVQRFIDKLQGIPLVKVSDGLLVTEPFILVTYTTGFGQVPETTLEFLESNNKYLQGVASSGNRNWGDNFGVAADKIAALYSVDVISKFELSGTSMDVEIFVERCGER